VPPTTPGAEAVLEELRRRRPHRRVLGGLGPLVAAIALAVAMITLLPSTAPEQVVERPVADTGQAAP